MQGSPISVGRNQFTVVNSERWGEIQSLGMWYPDTDGYIHTKFRKRVIYLHQFIYKDINPNYSGQVDHLDMNVLNNLDENLREATHGQNRMNTSLQTNNTSGEKGVSFSRKDKRYTAYIDIDKKRIHLGSFKTFEEAKEIRQAAAVRYHGKFARFN